MMRTSAHVELADALRAKALELGFCLVGITPARASEHMAFYRDWVRAGRHGEMAYLAREDAVARRADLSLTMADAASCVVVAHEYGQEDPPGVPADASRAVVARYARGRDYHRVVKGKLEALLAWVDGEVEQGVRGRAYVDTGPLLERELARRAGLGWFGRNTMLIHPRRGSYFFVGVLLVDVELPADTPIEEDRCGTCRACLDACPTGALLGRDADGAPMIDARRCISYLTIELRGPIPEELRPAIGNRVYGCDICQEVCPWNGPKFVRLTAERDYRPDWRAAPDRPEAPTDLPSTESPSLVALMRMSRDQWDRWTRGSAMRRSGYAGFRRNVAVAIGNWLSELDEPPEEAMAVLAEALDDEEPLVREHAAWALGRVNV